MVNKEYNSRRWSEARFKAFIKAGLRSLSRRWGPIHDRKKLARVGRGRYECAGYNRKPHIVDASLPPPKWRKKRVQNVYVDHIDPVIGPEGFVSWDETIKRMFVEIDGLQVLCKECHDAKTKDEMLQRKSYDSSKQVD